MRMLLSCVLLAACGPIYSQPQPPAEPPATAPQGGPPGASDPYAPPPEQAPTTAQGEPPMLAPPAQPARPAAPRPPPRDAAPALSADTQALVDAHNAARARHCAAPLTWSPQLAAAASRWANSLRDHNCAFEHSPNNTFGENLAGGTTGYLDGNAVVAMWYDEAKQYDFRSGAFSMQTGHFTQVVWRGTTQLGCARSTCGAQNQDIWVCEYDPAGNWEGQFRENVLPTTCH